MLINIRNPSGESIWINPDHVQCVTPLSSGCKVVMSDATIYYEKDGADHIAREINKGESGLTA